MAAVCPSCSHEIVIKDPRVGRFRIRCPRCGEKSSLSIALADSGEIRMDCVAIAPGSEVEAEARTTSSGASPLARVDPSAPPRTGSLPIGAIVRGGGGIHRIETLLREDPAREIYRTRELIRGRSSRLCILRAEAAADAAFVADAVRQARAASSLDHPNLEKIVGMFVNRRRPIAEIEDADAPTLAACIASLGKLDPDLAVSIVLHAARGLAAAHAQNLAHGAVRPEAIEIDSTDLVTLRGLGLVSTPAVRPPGYGPRPGEAARSEPAPRSRRDEQLDDIHDLGLTLLAAITGTPSSDLFPPRLPDGSPDPVRRAAALRVVESVAPGPRDLIMRSIADRREDRPSTIGEVIAQLERIVGIRSGEPFVPRPEDRSTIQAAAERFSSVRGASIRGWIEQGFTLGAAVIALLLLVGGRPIAAAAIVGLWAIAMAAHGLLVGLLQGSPLFERLRARLAAARPGELFAAAASILLAVAAAVVLDLGPILILLVVLGCGLAAGLYFGLDRPILHERSPALDDAEALIARMRRSGVSEDDIRRFVCREAGHDWEEFHEALFGFDATQEARTLWGTDERGRRPRFAPWRGTIARFLDDRLRAARDRHDRAWIQPIEEAGFMARGMNLVVARRRSWKTTEALLKVAEEIRASAAFSRLHPDVVVVAPLTIDDAIRQAVERPDQVLAADDVEPRRNLVADAAASIFGARVRFWLGFALVALCLLWAHQNAIFDAKQVSETIQSAIESQDPTRAGAIRIDYAKTDTQPLRLGAMPESAARFFNGWEPGIAGLILLLSSLIPGARASWFVIPGALIAFLAPILPIPAVPPLDARRTAAALGSIVAAAAFLFGRSRR
ncbi:MAG: hypothetical protein SFX72_09180 [Isosphaeraceae bacterium]|nr:hypothetical protein [Isosphaeraceae bacterium]